MNKEGVKPEHIVLTRWTGSEWQNLTTRAVGEDTEEYFFEAESPTLSVFAITALVPVVAPPPCTGVLSLTIVGNETCTVTASLTASNCDGLTWEVRDDGNIKCRGSVAGSSYFFACPTWTVTTGNYTYNLYIGGEPKDSSSVTCPPPPKPKGILEILLEYIYKFIDFILRLLRLR